MFDLSKHSVHTGRQNLLICICKKNIKPILRIPAEKFLFFQMPFDYRFRPVKKSFRPFISKVSFIKGKR